MILYIFQNCTYFDKKNLREIYEDTQKLEQGVPWKFDQGVKVMACRQRLKISVEEGKVVTTLNIVFSVVVNERTTPCKNRPGYLTQNREGGSEMLIA